MNEYDDLIDSAINRILSGKFIFSHNNTDYYYGSPSSFIRIKADNIYQTIYNDNMFSDSFLTETSLEWFLVKNKIIPNNYKSLQTKFDKLLDDTKISLYRNFKNKISRESKKKELEKIRKSTAELYSKVHSLDHLLLKSFCNRAKIEYILCNTIYYLGSAQLVFDYNNLDFKHFNQITQEMSNDPLKSIQFLKKIARSNEWRNIWTCNKNNVFPQSVSEWSDEQRAIVNISLMYDNIHEHPECPDDVIIADDDALDGWMLVQKNKSLQEKKQKGVEQLGKSGNSSEVFLMANDIEEASEIVDMNSDESLRIYKTRVKSTQEANRPIKEIEFMDVRQKLMEDMKDMRTI